jgi:hypothetical protein
MSKRRHWYHCSSTNHGPTWVAGRRSPSAPSEKEPAVPRLCVCPTIPACFAARLFDRDLDVYVYRTEKPQRSVTPKDVWDQVITGERWLVPPVSMVRVDVIDRITNGKINEAIRAYHVITKGNSSCGLRVAQYARAVEVLGGTKRELRLVAKMRELWEIDDPETYILEKAFA